MSKQRVTVTPQAEDAARTIGLQVRCARHELGWTISELAARLGVSRRTVAALEGGSAGTAIGTVLNAAVLTGVPLFGVDDEYELAKMRRRGEERLALLGQRVRSPKKEGTGP